MLQAPRQPQQPAAMPAGARILQPMTVHAGGRPQRRRRDRPAIHSQPPRGGRRHRRPSLGFFIFAGWGTLSEVSGAVIAPGKLVVDTNSRRCSTSIGGVVGTSLQRQATATASRRATSWCVSSETRPHQPRHRHQGARRDGCAPGRLEAERDGADKRHLSDRSAIARDKRSPKSCGR